MKNVGFGQYQNQSQKLIISPQLQHAIKLLQLSSLELAEKIESELAENPFLEEARDQNDENSNEKNEDRDFNQENKTLEDDIQQKNQDNSENYFEDSSDSGYIKKSSNYEGDSNSKQQFLENTFAVVTSLYEHLLGQLRLMDINDKEFHIGEIIISSLDENGYLPISVEELAESIPCDINEMNKVLDLVQSLDPPGIAGRNLQEVLQIQLKQLELVDSLAENIINEDLPLLEKNKIKEIASKYSKTILEVKDAIKFISQLEPIPARQFDSNQIKYIVPDISVKKVEGMFAISLNDSYMPDLRFNSDYKDIMASEKLADSAKDFFNNKYSEAKLLIFSLEKRKSTILKVVEQLIDLQDEFFERGPQYLKPLVLRDIAERIGMHESTVSRVTSNKYIETPWGIFGLKYFFSSGIRKSTGEMKSSRSIKEIIKEIIMNEKGEKALSDNKIVSILSNQGINIARRTVAKYRKSLKIEPSFKRKEI